MKYIRLSVVIWLLSPISLLAQSDDRYVAPPPGGFGLGFQFSGAPNLLFSWQGQIRDRLYWRLEPSIGFTFFNVLGTDSPASIVRVGLAYYSRYTVRNHHNLFFYYGPHVSHTEATDNNTPMITSLTLEAGPEYAVDNDQAFTIAGILALGASLRGWPRESASWDLTLATSAGLVIRYYF